MNIKTILILVIAAFVIFCGGQVVESGIFENRAASNQPCILLQQTFSDGILSTIEPVLQQKAQLKPAPLVGFTADDAPAEIIILGAADPNIEDPETGFKFQLQLTTKGAAIYKATFSNGNENGFDDRDYENPQPLQILSNVGDVLSMANTNFVFTKEQLQLRLNKLHWKSNGVQRLGDGSEAARFEAIIKNKQNGAPVIKLVKTYKVTPLSYQVDCDIIVENLSEAEQNVRFELTGPVGVNREGIRADMRKTLAVFKDSKGKFTRAKIDIKKFDGERTFDEKRLIKDSDRFLWVAVTNKYFAVILVPVPDTGEEFCGWVSDKTGRFYNPDGDKNTDDENIGVNLKIALNKLSPAGMENSSKKYNFHLYLGPKDKSIFDKNEYYRNLGFVYAIDFMGCLCPAAIIRPLAFGILAIMDGMYAVIGNYGVVIIILVFLIRLVIHPLTRKSQISMNKMQKLGPKVAELKKKYANNKAEQHKQTMALYKEMGVSPVSSMLPMMVQMPIWISLYSAIYASIALRGAAFLPFWITDLSAPDALFRFKAVTLPLFGVLDSFNLLPLMMGVAFYLQQKLMPKPADAQVDPQVAQQQKMMMIMMPLLFPLMLYKAPSGLNLYIMASTFAGVVEQYVIRKHIREKEQTESIGVVVATSKTGGKVKKKKPKPFHKKYL